MTSVKVRKQPNNEIVVLGVGSASNGDAGIGYHAATALTVIPLPRGVRVIEGEAGFNVLPQISEARSIFFIDAVNDGKPVGTITKLQPRVSEEFPASLVPHNVALRDVVDALHSMGRSPSLTLFTVSIHPENTVSGQLSAQVLATLQPLLQAVRNELIDLTSGL